MNWKTKVNLFDVVNYIIVLGFAITIIIPMWNILVISFSTYKAYISDPYHLLPLGFTLKEYQRAFLSSKDMLISLWASIRITGLGTLISMILTTMGGYALSKNALPGRKIIFRLIIFTMFFGGGLAPFYVLIKNLNIDDTIWCLTLPGAISTYNLILMKNYFTTISPSLEEAAKIDGYNDIQILFKVILPMAKPVLAAISLFYAVGYWNDYFNAILFINKQSLMPFQLYLRDLVIQNVTAAKVGVRTGPAVYEQFKMAVIIIGIIPVVMIYPFVQKYFTKGVLLGSVKE